MLQDHDIPLKNFDLDANAPVLGKIGPLSTRLARTIEEVRKAQALRYEVFYNEMAACPAPEIAASRLDEDDFDAFCDHLLVLDTAADEPQIVGTYRLLRQVQAESIGRFYSQSEFDLTQLFDNNSTANFLELGRSCILPHYRNKRTMELLWHGTWSYAVAHKVDIMFGCASFEGSNPSDHRNAFCWLAQNAILPVSEHCPPSSSDHVNLRQYEKEEVNLRTAMASMPPLLKGYIRLGAKIADHAVIDTQFGTIDVLVVLKTAQINPRYLSHFGVDASRFAAKQIA